MKSQQLLKALVWQIRIYKEWFKHLRKSYREEIISDNAFRLADLLQGLGINGLCVIDSGYAYRDEIAVIHLASCYLRTGETEIRISIPQTDRLLAPLSIYKKGLIKPQGLTMPLYQPWIEPMPLIAELAFMRKVIDHIPEKQWIIVRHGPLIQQLPQYERETYYITKEQLRSILEISAWDDEEINELFEDLDSYHPEKNHSYVSSRILLMLLYKLCEECQRRKIIPVGFIENPSRSGFLLRYLIAMILREIMQNIDSTNLSEQRLIEILDLRIDGPQEVKGMLCTALKDYLLRKANLPNNLSDLNDALYFKLSTEFRNKYMSKPQRVFDLDFFQVAAAENIREFEIGEYLREAIPRISIDEAYFSPITKSLITKLLISEESYEPVRTYCFVDNFPLSRDMPQFWNIGLRVRKPLALEIPKYWFDNEKEREKCLAYFLLSSRMNKLGIPPAVLTADAYAKLMCSDYKILKIMERIIKGRWTHLYFRTT